jgi:hypothetical protein
MALTKVSFSMIKGAYFNVLDYGAVGNGTTEDTVAFDLAIAAAAVGGGTVFVPSGTYYVDRVDMSSDVALVGELGSVLKRKGNIIIGVAYDAAIVDNVRIENIEFDDNAPSGPSAIWKICMYIANATNVTVSNCHFYNGYDISIKAQGPDGIYIETGASGRNSILIENCLIEQFTRNGISITDGANDVTITGCTFKDCGLFGVDVESDAGDATYARNITVENCDFINNGNFALREEATVTGGLSFGSPNPVTAYHNLNTRVSGCYFKTTTATNATGITYLSISSTFNMIVTDCIFDIPDTGSDHSVTFDTGSFESENGIVSNNVFRVRVESYTFGSFKFHGNTLNGSLAYLVMAGLGTGKLISGNNFFNAGDITHPIIQAYSRALTIGDNSFRDTRILGVAPAAVLQIAGASAGTTLFTLDAVISNNNVFGEYGSFVNMSGGSSAYGLKNVKFNGNRITSTEFGIKLNSSGTRPNSLAIDIENNTFTDLTGTALYLFRVSGLKVNGNSFYNCSTNTDVILLSECSNYIANSNIVNDTRSGGARATYAINASGNPTPSALLSSNLSVNTQSGFTIAGGEGTVANNTTY